MIEKAKQISAALEDYFTSHPHEQQIPAKDLMPLFIKEGIFNQDHRNGLPIRNVLRNLDRIGQLHVIPHVHVERKTKNTNWYFVNRKQKISKTATVKPNETVITSALKRKNNSDEDYIIDLCDKVLNSTALRQHRFDFLRGDTGVKLPVDAYYPNHNLVIEYHEKQHTEDVTLWDKKPTVSGMSRKEQRKLYDERRKELIPKHGLKLFILDYSQFQHNPRTKRLFRDPEKDMEKLKGILKDK